MNTALQTIVDLTHRVATLAEQGEWAGAAQLDQERQMHLRTFCAGLSPEAASPELIQTLTEILKLNDTLIGSMRHQQRALLRDAETVRTGQRAVAAYGAGSRTLAY